ncbi:Iron transport multicopper oxidase fetC [Colletotrichum siamense]|uniref:Iron transport multicopper oxidase fetC n=1 Tax=Colletotrichum siamense TaxID=690259 RepID=UPI001872BE7F|nr:Iron transport multicopper oxidase fetC [Colletotrichum siamense]KAF5495342.1 Iron transport multicopper oxidase fetC [Colletotrichum siamense]
MAKALLLALACSALRQVTAATVTYDFSIGWVRANPDGAFERPVIGINGQWPIPRIEANIGDNIIVNAYNALGNQSTSLHFHGLFMNGTTHMDGPSQVSQCPIPPGSNFTYNFTITQPGTYWYHSHTKSQYPDGLRGPLIIHDPDNPYRDQYDEEVIVTLSDWYHEQMQVLIPPFMSKTNPTGAEPVPKAALMNETQNLTISIQPGKTYFFRVINIGAFAGQYLWFEGHNISIVEVDGVYTQPAEADMIYLSAAQRCSFLLTTKNDTTQNYPIVGSMDTTLFDTLPDDLNWNVTGWLTYDSSKSFPEPALIDGDFQPFDDMTLVPHDSLERFGEPEQTVELDVIMDNLGDGANYAFFNNISYASPKVPTLYTALTTGDTATNPEVYGTYTHSFVLKKDEIVQIVVNNLDTGRHPFHLHGHHFQALYRGEESSGTFEQSNMTESDFPQVPMRRDTLVIWPEGNIVLRFKADNPGVWLFHCHIEWHVTSGLLATFVEAPLELQKSLTLPQNHLDVCNAGNVPTAGNAAANTVDLLDLSGQNSPPAPLPAGFTTRGIVAFVFSCLTGLLGVLVVCWYGMAGSGSTSNASPSSMAVREPATTQISEDGNQKQPISSSR